LFKLNQYVRFSLLQKSFSTECSQTGRALTRPSATLSDRFATGEREILPPVPAMTALADLAGSDRMAGILALLERNDVSGQASAELLRGGKNNRVIRLVPDTGTPLVLKVYFRSAADTRDRLKNEFSFARYAWAQGLRTLPEPIDAEPSGQCALFEFVAGTQPLYPPTPAMIAEALAFVQEINRERFAATAAGLPTGSEACFSIAAHIDLVNKRVDRLMPTDARPWIEDQLLPLWRTIENSVLSGAASRDVDPERTLDERERIVSPSDFGFHNAIARAAGGRLCFHDFEYAGWDDPAKLFGDFFNQIEMPLPYEFLGLAARSFLAFSQDPRELAWRMRALLPVYAVKWCCIALNPFVAADAARRQFAGHDAGEILRHSLERAARQLDRAQYFHQLGDWLTDA
jgi:hypothetical protein